MRFLLTYWSFAFTISLSFYAIITWFGTRHLSIDSKETLTLWLWGEYESTWATHFCNMFDAVFGKRHLSWQCFFRSSIASLVSVILFYILFAKVLGVMSERTPANLPFLFVLLAGPFLNFVPDYLSLFETRWLLYRFRHINSAFGHLSFDAHQK